MAGARLRRRAGPGRLAQRPIPGPPPRRLARRKPAGRRLPPRVASGAPGMLVALAATGSLRGRQNTRTPLVVAVGGAVINAVLSAALVPGAGLGTAGSGLGTTLTQTGMAIALGAVAVRKARRVAAPLRPAAVGLLASARAGAPLVVRTLSLRLAILVTVVVAASLGDVALARRSGGGRGVGSGGLRPRRPRHRGPSPRRGLARGPGPSSRPPRHRTVAPLGGARRSSDRHEHGSRGWWFTPLFTPDADVRHAAALTLVVAGLCQPVAGWAFVLDGVVIGAGDGRFLAAAGLVTLAVYAPVPGVVGMWAPAGADGLALLWAAFGGAFMLSRAVTTGIRARGERVDGPRRRRLTSRRRHGTTADAGRLPPRGRSGPPGVPSSPALGARRSRPRTALDAGHRVRTSATRRRRPRRSGSPRRRRAAVRGPGGSRGP